jgi:hypothetical protein
MHQYVRRGGGLNEAQVMLLFGATHCHYQSPTLFISSPATIK